MNRRNLRRRPTAFTLIELLLVITIIVLLIMLFMPIWASTKNSLNRMNCQLNLSNCAKILIQYASNNNSWLPNFGANNNLETGITEGTSSTMTQFPLVDELKRYGANAAIFTCPASAAAQDHSYRENSGNVSVWGTWDAVSAQPEGNPPNGFYSHGTTKQVWTYGYAFFCRNNIAANQMGIKLDFFFLDGREMPYQSNDDGTLPLGADMIAFGPGFANQAIYPSYPGNGWYGMAHEPNAILTENLAPVPGGIMLNGVPQVYPQTGGGNVVFLNGTCQWFDVGQLYSGISSITPSTTIQPMFFGESWKGGQGVGQYGNNPRDTAKYPFFPQYTQYYFGDQPQSASSKLSN